MLVVADTIPNYIRNNHDLDSDYLLTLDPLAVVMVAGEEESAEMKNAGLSVEAAVPLSRIA